MQPDWRKVYPFYKQFTNVGAAEFLTVLLLNMDGGAGDGQDSCHFDPPPPSVPPPSPDIFFILGAQVLRTLLHSVPNLIAVVSKPSVTVCTYSLALYIFCRNVDVTYVGVAHDRPTRTSSLITAPMYSPTSMKYLDSRPACTSVVITAA